MRRYLLGAVGIILCTSVAIASIAIGAITTIAADISLGGKPLKSKELTSASLGAPETIMILGDDHIGPTTTYSTGAYETVNGVHLLHADTFMLVRMDPAQGETSILSIPRDLLVNFSWHGVAYSGKFNEVYSVSKGNLNLLLRVTKHLLPGLTINHIIDFNFASFLGLINAIGCVYIDVDQRYYNPPGQSFQPINLQPGYQRLCGKNALAYVRFRHTDSDFVRVARQQDFIRQAKQQLGVFGFLSRWQPLATAFGRAVATDINGGKTVATLIQLAAGSLGRPVRHVAFQVNNTNFGIGTQTYVTSTPALIRASVDDFLYRHPKAPALSTATLPTHSTSHSHHRHHTTPSSSTPALGVDDLYPLSAGVSAKAGLIGVSVPFPVLLPSVQTGPATPNDFHAYTVRDEQNHPHAGYRIDWSINGAGGFYGIEGMNWASPPLFANAPSAVYNGRTYLFVDDGSHWHDIGWRVGSVLYWVSNTQLEELTNTQMLKIAESAQPVG
jgi:LCP family protein required for cell wall assembly